MAQNFVQHNHNHKHQIPTQPGKIQRVKTAHPDNRKSSSNMHQHRERILASKGMQVYNEYIK